jgi:hypothetical protein
MVQRLIPKTTIRFLGIQFDGTNQREILSFCKMCYAIEDKLYFHFHHRSIKIEVGEWIVNTYDDEFNVLTDKEVKAIFKPLGSR